MAYPPGPSNLPAMLQVNQLCKDYPTRSGPLSVLRDVSLALHRGVAVARALIRHPSVLLADEPTGNLDRHAALAVGQLLLDLHRQEQTVLVVVTHSAELARRLPRQMEMVDGSLKSAGGAQ